MPGNRSFRFGKIDTDQFLICDRPLINHFVSIQCHELVHKMSVTLEALGEDAVITNAVLYFKVSTQFVLTLLKRSCSQNSTFKGMIAKSTEFDFLE